MVSARAALVLGTVLVAACERGSPPSGQTPTPAVETRAQSARSEPANAGDAPPAFVVGEIKSAADYLREPQFAAADLKRGELLSLACAACHSFRAGEKTVVGPNLHGVFGRAAGTVEGFDYSPGLRSSGLIWTPRSLDAWLADPASFVAGTKMTFTGYRLAEDRRDLIAYLLKATQ
jgi:cytochrome c